MAAFNQSMILYCCTSASLKCLRFHFGLVRPECCQYMPQRSWRVAWPMGSLCSARNCLLAFCMESSIEWSAKCVALSRYHMIQTPWILQPAKGYHDISKRWSMVLDFQLLRQVWFQNPELMASKATDLSIRWLVKPHTLQGSALQESMDIVREPCSRSWHQDNPANGTTGFLFFPLVDGQSTVHKCVHMFQLENHLENGWSSVAMLLCSFPRRYLQFQQLMVSSNLPTIWGPWGGWYYPKTLETSDPMDLLFHHIIRSIWPSNTVMIAMTFSQDSNLIFFPMGKIGCNSWRVQLDWEFYRRHHWPWLAILNRGKSW